MDYLIFTFEDDSNEKLTIETFLVLFIFLAVGLTLGIIVLLLEMCPQVDRKEERKATMGQSKTDGGTLGKWNFNKTVKNYSFKLNNVKPYFAPCTH